MMRDYSTGQSKEVTAFTGIEIEKTAFIGDKTLFIVGMKPLPYLLSLARKTQCKHVYLGANHSYNPQCFQWFRDAIIFLLNNGLNVTLDLKFEYREDFKNAEFSRNPQFCLNIGLNFDDLKDYPVNTYLKIDDRDFNASNEGVWVEKLTNITNNKNFTSWGEYGKDEIL